MCKDSSKVTGNVRALKIRIGLGGHYTVTIVGNPKTLFKIVKAPTLTSGCRVSRLRTSGFKIQGPVRAPIDSSHPLRVLLLQWSLGTLNPKP